MTKPLGHNDKIDTLVKTLRQNRLPNAFLFCGPRGVGKFTTALYFAKLSACTNAERNEWQPCEKCPACRKIDSENHPDIFVIKAENNCIKIGQIRELQQKLQFHPLESFIKLVIIDDADLMNEAASNSLLKVLEEPPTQTHFILTSSSPTKLLPTIRSRCQSLSFQPLNKESIADFLIREKQIDREQATRIAKFSAGSIGYSLGLEPELIDEVMLRLNVLSKRSTSADIFETASGWAGLENDKIRIIVDILASFYMDIYRFHSTGDVSTLIHPESESACQKIGPAKAEKNIFEIEAVRKGLEGNANKQLMFEQLLFTLTA